MSTHPGGDPDEQYAHLEPLVRKYAQLEPDDPERARLRDELVLGFSPVAQHLAYRYARRGVPHDDLVQVATIGLINAVDRFDPDKAPGNFLGFAVPTMTGEIRRYFRDHTWAMRVPRGLKELHLRLQTASTQLSGTLGRAPRPSELAAHLGVSVEEVLEGLQVKEAYATSSIDQPVGTSSEATSLAELLGQADARLELTENLQALKPLLDALPERERTIIMLRFYAEMSQTQIAEIIGVSQMHISRLIAQTLAQLREGLTA